MEDLSTKTAIIYDHGTFVSIAERLGKDFGRVLYYSECKSAFPQKKLTLPGYGLQNVERINNFWDYVPEADVFVFPDVMDGDIQVHLRDLGKQVFGSFKGEDMELNRQGMKEYMKELNLPVGHYEVVKGIDALRKYCKAHKNIWVKIDTYRGDFETLQAKNYAYIELKFDEIERELGAVKNEVEFICEDDLDNKVEMGYDGYCIDGKFPTQTLQGIEVKDLGYVGVMRPYNKLPEPVKHFNDVIVPTMKQYGYRNFFSTEVRIGKDKVGYMTDACCRTGSPPNELYQNMFTNFSQIVWEGAHGRCIDPIPQSKVGVEVLVHCSWAEKNWLPIQFPEKYYDNLKFRNVCVIEGQHYIVPQYVGLPEIGAIVATGETLDEALAEVEEIADSVRGYYVDVPLNAIDKAKEEIEKFKNLGYNLFE